jgi:hypothetical protein
MGIRDSFTEEQKQRMIKQMLNEGGHYESYLKKLSKLGWDISPIRETVSAAIDKIKAKTKSFVIYGEPQCGKTGMMVGLTSKLIDEGNGLIIILLNDSVKLLRQNLKRFVESSIKPTPRVATEVFETGFIDKRNILFCKKNIRDLSKLLELTKNQKKIIIDDEADYATPNAKINKSTRTAINNAIHKMINGDTVYIGVTATPARLDLNNTFDTENENWVYFKPHHDYVGKNEFFLNTDGGYQRYNITTNEKKDLEKAVIAFIVNATYLNCLHILTGEKGPENYGLLIHTSGKIIDHKTDANIVRSVVSALTSPGDKNYTRMIKEASKYIDKREKIKEFGQDNIINLITQDISSHKIVVMNSDYDTRDESTTPEATYTFFIGGNVVSRGVTFDNLLGMYFTRSAKHNIQQDTYIQRARMFGSRKNYLEYFQLWISEDLFNDWQRCFVYHYISLETLKETDMAPIWLSGGRVTPTSRSSIDKRNIFTSLGEVVSKKFDYSLHGDLIEHILNQKETPELIRLKNLRDAVSTDFLNVILGFIQHTSDTSLKNINILPIRNVSPSSDYHDSLFRHDGRGIMGGQDYKNTNKDHHILILKNQNGEARIVYRYSAIRIRFFSKTGVGNGS